MIEVKRTRGQDPEAATSDPYAAKSTKPLSKVPGALGVGLTALAIYLKSFLGPAEASEVAQPDPARPEDEGRQLAARRLPGQDASEAPPSAPGDAAEKDASVVPDMVFRPESGWSEAANRDMPPVGAWKPALLTVPEEPLVSSRQADAIGAFGPPPARWGERIEPPRLEGGGAGLDLGGEPSTLDLEAMPEEGKGPTPPKGSDDGGGRNRAPRHHGPVYLNDIGGTAAVTIMMSQLLSQTEDRDGDQLEVRKLTVSSGTLKEIEGGWVYRASAPDSEPVTFTYEVWDGVVAVAQVAQAYVVDRVLHGAGGADRLTGRAGSDSIEGLEGHDRLVGHAGADRLYGGEGNDRIAGGDDDDVLIGLDGADVMFGGAGNDWILGGRGDDVIEAGAGDDVAFGDVGYDVLKGGGGKDYLDGGAGDDRLDGGGGEDRLMGALGHDLLDGGSGNDLLSGGQGDDSLLGQDGDDDLAGGKDDDLLDGGAGQDFLLGEDGNDQLIGGLDNDLLDGGAGADAVSGGDGDDLVRAGSDGSDDVLDGGNGTDRLDYSDSQAEVLIDLILDTVTDGQGGTDHIENFEVIVGSSHDDVFIAHNLSDSEVVALVGGEGDDLFTFLSSGLMEAPIALYQIRDFDSGDRVKVNEYEFRRESTQAKRELETTVDDFFEDITDRLGGETDPRIRFTHEWTDLYQRTLLEVDFDRDGSFDLEVLLDGQHDFVLVTAPTT